MYAIFKGGCQIELRKSSGFFRKDTEILLIIDASMEYRSVSTVIKIMFNLYKISQIVLIMRIASVNIQEF